MRQMHLRHGGTVLLAAMLVLQTPMTAFAKFTPPTGGGHGATLSGVVIDPPRQEPRRGRVVEEPTDPNSLWILAGAGIALALLINSNASSPTPVLGDCADLFKDLFDTPNNENNATAASADCFGRSGAAFLGPLVSAAFTLPDPGAGQPSFEERLAQTLLPTAAPETAALELHSTGRDTLAAFGQPEGTQVAIHLDEYMMRGKEYPATFTVTAQPGTDLSQPLYLVAADLAQAGDFVRELGVPFAVPVDMDVLRREGSWTYSTPYRADGGVYFLDAFVSTQLPAMLKADPGRDIQVLDRLARDIQNLERKGTRAQADREALNAHYLWLLEWNRHTQQ